MGKNILSDNGFEELNGFKGFLFISGNSLSKISANSSVIKIGIVTFEKPLASLHLLITASVSLTFLTYFMTWYREGTLSVIFALKLMYIAC